MKTRFLAVAIALVASTVAFAQSDPASAPRTVLGFLKSGMHLRITHVDGTTSVILHTYTEEDYKIVQELKEQLSTSLKTASSVAETNAYVREKFQEYATRRNLGEDARSRIMIMPIGRALFGTIEAVGDDYILLKLNDEDNGKRVIPKASIGTIYLDAKPVSFIDMGAKSRGTGN